MFKLVRRPCVHIFYDQVVSMESLVSCLGAGGGDGEGGGGEVEKLAQQLATLEVRLISSNCVMN